MVKWIDIVSPGLRGIHQQWCELREGSLIPHLTRYNTFLMAAEETVSLTAVFPAKGGAPAFRTVGSTVARDFPGVRGGMSFAELQPILLRTLLTVPFHEVHANRQPDCRRGSLRRPNGARRYEQLLLPFGDERLRVCLVHALFFYDSGA